MMKGIMWIIFALLSATFAALVAIFGKIGIQNVDSTLATTIRAIVMAVFLITASFALGSFKLFEQINSKILVFIILSGVAGAISWFFYFWALRLGPASAVAALDRLSVVFVLILSLLFLGESFSWVSVLGAVLLTVGAVLMVVK